MVDDGASDSFEIVLLPEDASLPAGAGASVLSGVVVLNFPCVVVVRSGARIFSPGVATSPVVVVVVVEAVVVVVVGRRRTGPR